MYLQISEIAAHLRDSINERSKTNTYSEHFFFLSGKASKVKGHLQRNSSIRSEEYRVVGDFEHSIGISR